jgi:hypothetical protein
MIGLCLKYEQINYGSKLQALATIRMMEDLGQECRVIHYGKAGLWFKLKSLTRIFNATFRQDKLALWSHNRAYQKHPEVAPMLTLRGKLFKEYDAKHFDKYEVFGAYYSDIQKIASKYDAIVTCSDQLWSPAGLRTNFYNLMFVPDSVKKISFASSFGVSQIPWYQKKATAKYLGRINYVSCRENRGAEIVKELTGRDVPVLMDPVFAFDKLQWEKLVPAEKVYDEPYIFCYFLGSNIAHRKAVRAYADKKGLKLVFLKYLDQYVEYDEHFGDITPFDVDPNKFLNILRGAEYVLTDSFHGCAFSILMEKKFGIFNRYSTSSSASKNSRIDTVCSNLELEGRRVVADSDLDVVMNADIDWKSVKEKTQVYRDRMWKYMRKALEK